MSNRVSLRATKSALALAGLLVGVSALAGCTSLGGFSGITGSTGSSTASDLNQTMPSALPTRTKVASGPYLPPADVGGGTGPGQGTSYVTGVSSPDIMPPANPSRSSVVDQDLPALANSQPSLGSPKPMSAQPMPQPVQSASAAPAPIRTPPAAAPAQPKLTVVPENAYAHTIEAGESLYVIARRYGVTTDAILHANNIASPDKIFVGQKIYIPGRPDLAPKRAETAPAAPAQAAQQRPTQLASAAPAQAAPRPTAAQPAPQQTASIPAAQPAKTGATFRWPVSGRVITDFTASKGTGINIEVPEGATVHAAEAGTVIYVGDAVEGYGNLVLVRHDNGFVSAYAHLKAATVQKGDVLARGQAIGAAGMTGAVSRPQLHFELRKGATPVDPMPLLAS